MQLTLIRFFNAVLKASYKFTYKQSEYDENT